MRSSTASRRWSSSSRDVFVELLQASLRRVAELAGLASAPGEAEPETPLPSLH
jgi:hypothetical protein